METLSETWYFTLVEALALLMLLMALLIASARTVQQMIRYYQWQCLLLAVITFVVGATPDAAQNTEGVFRINVIIFAAIPLLLAYLIEPLLANATVPEELSFGQRWRRLTSRSVYAEIRRRALPSWLEKRPTRRGAMLYLAVNLGLMVLAYFVAHQLLPPANAQEINQGIPQANSLAVSLALVLVGLVSMTNKQDIISQIMGLLVMEDGLFLAAIRVTAVRTVISTFIVSLFLYTIITLLLLAVLLPELHRLSGTLEIDEQQQQKG